MQLSTLDHNTVQQIGKQILNTYRNHCSSFEDASQRLVKDVFASFQSSQKEPEFALLRVFRTLTFEQLTPELQTIAPSKTEQYLTLMGTVGLEEAWCDRHQSKSRKAIQINQNMSPMFKGIFRELGFSWDDSTGDELVSGESLGAMSMIRYFYVEDVSSSTYITDQKTFVKPYGIQSVIAAGSRFITGGAYVVIGFTTVPVTREQAEILVQLTPHISTLLAIFDAQGALWS